MISVNKTSRLHVYGCFDKLRLFQHFLIYIYLPSNSLIVIVALTDSFLLDIWFSTHLELLSVKKPGSLGSGIDASSHPNMKTTDDMAGLSSASFWTQSKPTCMHRLT